MVHSLTYKKDVKSDVNNEKYTEEKRGELQPARIRVQLSNDTIGGHFSA
jgi:hypothetical protein|tara:strand:- start:376 stop:522 length:147 start_codon:yes stop_codon:yes gene_type:complete